MFRLVKKKFSRQNLSNRPEAPIYICCYHKVATVLLANVFRGICREFGWNFKSFLGNCDVLPAGVDVVLFQHSLIDLDSVNTPYLGAHFIRDPRDVIVSGYLYHKRCNEEWCTHSDFNYQAPILYPNVPYSQQHRSEEWKRQYLYSLENMSYQQNLHERNESEGLLFEMEHYGAWTIDSMLSWNYNNPNVEEIKFEAVMMDYSGTFKRLFERFGFNKEQIANALEVVVKEDINRMTEDEIEKNPHISSRQTTKWDKFFLKIHKEVFKERFGNALVQLGYESSNDW